MRLKDIKSINAMNTWKDTSRFKSDERIKLNENHREESLNRGQTKGASVNISKKAAIRKPFLS